MVSMELNSPGYRLEELIGTGKDDVVVDAYVGDIRDVCEQSGQSLPKDVQPTMRPGETVQLTIGDIKKLMTEKAAEKSSASSK